jgi:hypothetical protein
MRINDAGIDCAAHWNALRRIGNSWIGKDSIALPILSYLILFQDDIIRYLRLHSSFCENCEVSWRLHLFYFGCCFFAVGSLLCVLTLIPLISRERMLSSSQSAASVNSQIKHAKTPNRNPDVASLIRATLGRHRQDFLLF